MQQDNEASQTSSGMCCEVYLRHFHWIPGHDYQNYRLEVLLSKGQRKNIKDKLDNIVRIDRCISKWKSFFCFISRWISLTTNNSYLHNCRAYC